ncbi:MAG: AAA family ATPase [Candidatus Omnitrophica bacterium]|nr:AAA family ATPase [Candidatus Omnitrophota bacterium]MBU1869814.1 AAA family ATPase [Candidatus Omnitrophota bacterium]
MRKIFIAATKQNDGKTTVSLGLLSNFKDGFKKVGFIKPIGQRYLEEVGQKIDEDSFLIEEVCGIKCGLKDMSPIAVEKGFTEKYIARPDKNSIAKQIKDSYRRVSKGQDLVVIEGTGHAGVGSVFDHSNATVAKLLGSKVIIISSGGIGRPIDEIILNKALFEREGVKVLGVIVNKVLPTKFDKISRLVRKGLERKGVKVLGVLPYNPMLSQPTIEQILEETDFEVLSGKENLERTVSRVIVGAMEPRDALKYIVDDSLIITPGDREDMIKSVLSCFRDSQATRLKVCGMILSGGIKPDEPVLALLKNSGIPVLMAESDTYDVATTVHDLTVKLRPRDKEKISAVVKLIKDYVDLKEIYRGM